ncbi:hypothetical protein [Pseudokordiimonas caeni]|uniref:hypothetical protein n=1 Tax=Pseudokordiimonas caeni TaxID=2997908 RepID=UPI002810F06C|nr:hypothetical protein [Pseudokordiimonas caeni]
MSNDWQRNHEFLATLRQYYFLTSIFGERGAWIIIRIATYLGAGFLVGLIGTTSGYWDFEVFVALWLGLPGSYYVLRILFDRGRVTLPERHKNGRTVGDYHMATPVRHFPGGTVLRLEDGEDATFKHGELPFEPVQVRIVLINPSGTTMVEPDPTPKEDQLEATERPATFKELYWCTLLTFVALFFVVGGIVEAIEYERVIEGWVMFAIVGALIGGYLTITLFLDLFNYRRKAALRMEFELKQALADPAIREDILQETEAGLATQAEWTGFVGALTGLAFLLFAIGAGLALTGSNAKGSNGALMSFFLVMLPIFLAMYYRYRQAKVAFGKLKAGND